MDQRTGPVSVTQAGAWRGSGDAESDAES